MSPSERRKSSRKTTRLLTALRCMEDGKVTWAGFGSALNLSADGVLLELPDRLTCNPRALRAGYLEALHAYLDEVRRGCASHVVDYALVRTSQPLDVALATYLSSRLGMHHRN